MEKKFSVADFAQLVGTTSKTIYQKIENYDNLPINEQLSTVKEKVKGREITFIVTNSEQIAYFQNLYGKNTVNESNYYENVTNLNGYSQVNNDIENIKPNNNNISNNSSFDKLLTLNETYLNRIETVTNELMEYKSKTLLLEDKASREGLYLNEIKGLETENNKLKTYNKVLFTILTIIVSVLLTVFITLMIVNNTQPEETDQKNTVVQEVPIQPIKNLSPKRK